MVVLGGHIKLAGLLMVAAVGCKAPVMAMAVLEQCVQRRAYFKTGVGKMSCQRGPAPISPCDR